MYKLSGTEIDAVRRGEISYLSKENDMVSEALVQKLKTIKDHDDIRFWQGAAYIVDQIAKILKP